MTRYLPSIFVGALVGQLIAVYTIIIPNLELKCDTQKLTKAVKASNTEFYMLGYQDGSARDDIGLVRLTVDDVEKLL